MRKYPLCAALLLSCLAILPMQSAAPLYTSTNLVTDSVRPALTCAYAFYARPGIRLMQRLRATPAEATIQVKELPRGLRYNTKRQRIEGVVEQAGVYTFPVTVAVGKQTVTQQMRLEVSDSLVSPTPMMGWMSWNSFEGALTAADVRAMADALVSSGLKDAGYNYLCIDDLWHAQARTADGKPQYDKQKYPQGMRALTDYVHSKGLKIGIYSDAATQTCAGAFGSLGYEVIDAQQYADWGFDFLKYDYCAAPPEVDTARLRYTVMSDALKLTGRPFYYSVCEWGERKPWEWAAAAGGHSWRCTYDSRDTWDHGAYDGGHCGVVQAIDQIRGTEYYAGPNRYNDMDMLMTGLYGRGKSSSHDGANGMTDREYQTQFTMWSILTSPLIIVPDLRTINAATKHILTNKEVIAINQDPMGQQASCVSSNEGLEIYAKELANGDVAVAMLNRTSQPTRMHITLKELHLKGTHTVRDLWLHTDLMRTNKVLEAAVAGHEARIFRLRKGK